MLSTPWGQVFTRLVPGSGPTTVLLHGYPTSSYDWHAVLPQLTGRIVMLDFLGFGLSDKPSGHSYSLFEQADIVEHVVGELVDGPVNVVAHDMGTSVATELMARDLAGDLGFELSSVVLSNGSVILERATLRPIQRLMRSPFGPVVGALSNRRMFTRQLGAVFSAEHPLTADEAAAHWELLAAHNGHRQVHRLSAYLHERVRHADRWHGAVRDWPGRLGLLWGTEDPVATTSVLDGLRFLRPAADVVVLDGVGHYPQLKTPERFVWGLAQLSGL